LMILTNLPADRESESRGLFSRGQRNQTSLIFGKWIRRVPAMQRFTIATIVLIAAM